MFNCFSSQVVLQDFSLGERKLRKIKKIFLYLFESTIFTVKQIYSEFAKEKARQTKSGKYQKIREKRLVDEAVKGYTEWIQQAGMST